MVKSDLSWKEEKESPRSPLFTKTSLRSLPPSSTPLYKAPLELPALRLKTSLLNNFFLTQ